VGEIRFAIKTKREEVIERITNSERTPEELGLRELAEFVNNNEGKERIEAEILWQRRIILSATPLIFALLGTALVLRFNRGGKGFGIFLALVSLVAYYLIALLGEQLARTGTIRVQTAGLMPISASVIAITALLLSNRFNLRKSFGKSRVDLPKSLPINLKKLSRKNFYIDLTTGILDFDIISNVIKYFVLTVAFLSSIFVIFTAFELWKFAGMIENGVLLLSKYLLFLFPFIYIQLAPSAVMIAVLATYIIKSRQNEIVTWTAAGRSIYRLLLPCFLVMILLGLFNWAFQEKILPQANRIQDVLREQIRSRGNLARKEGRLWMSNDNRIYSFETTQENFSKRKVTNLSIYEFSEDGAKIQTVYKSPEAIWNNEKIKLSEGAEQIIWSNSVAEIHQINGIELEGKSNPFAGLYNKPTHLNTEETLEKIKTTESESEQRSFAISLEKKYTTLFLPFIITLFTAPFGMSLSRKSKVVTVGYAVALWLIFMGISNVFEQFGLNGSISPKIAVWSPLLLFSILGVLLLSKVKT
ncbi:MAG TPA: LptF/LptG family permease, partial [Pyrinomonadaceae bacterium]|nr:LptF/LptG family permease [Pyrinomonadaceae bacterium]